jgi:cytochrome P450
MDRFDPLSAHYLANPVPVLKRLQAEQPVFFYEPLGCWVVSKFADIRSAFLDHETYSSQATSFVRPPEDLADAVADFTRDQIIIMLDPPEHSRHRNAMAKGFGSAAIKRLEEQIAAAANRLIDEIEPLGGADLMNRFCIPLTMETIITVLGIPGDRRGDYRQWSEDFFSLLTPRSSKDEGEGRTIENMELRDRWARLADASCFVKAYIEKLRQEPTDNILSDMVHAKTEDGAPALDDGDIVGHMLSLIGAGHDTTANSIAHTVHFLSANPEQRDAIIADPDLIPRAVEEGLRMRGSVPGLFRVTTRDVTISGVDIPANALIYFLVAAAGHDESVFPDSTKFDVQRENAGKHLAFGIGRHTCIGSALARLQASVAIRELYKRLPNVREVPGHTRTYLPMMTVTGLQSLEVVWDQTEAI